MPPTVQAVLAARIDRLAEREKAVLQAAAVIGKEFSEPVLQRVRELEPARAARGARRLCGARVRLRAELYPEAQYAFKHPLTQEVAYGSQLGERRPPARGRGGDALEEMTRIGSTSAPRCSPALGAGGRAVKAARWHARAAAWAGRTTRPTRCATGGVCARCSRARMTTPRRSGLALGACMWTLQFDWRRGGPMTRSRPSGARDWRWRSAAGNTWAKSAGIRLARRLTRDGRSGRGGARARHSRRSVSRGG